MTVGIIIVPLLLAKLWSVIPRLFAWPPVTGPVNALERIGILLLVGSAIFQFATGIANAQLYYPWHFDFLEAHYYGGLIFIASLVLHVAVKFPAMRRAYATRREVIAPATTTCVPPIPTPGRSAAVGCSGSSGRPRGRSR